MAAPASVDAYLATLPEDRRTTLEALRSIVRSAAPDAIETISYGMPTLRLDGRFLVSFAAFKGHYSLFPASDEVRTRLGETVARHLAGRGTIRFAWDEPVPEDLVRRIVTVRLEEHGARADR